MPAKNHASTRYSGLEEISAANVKDLKVDFTFSTGVNKGQESAPIVVDDTLTSSRRGPTSSTRSTSPSPARR